jgi:hypothetical protein
MVAVGVWKTPKWLVAMPDLDGTPAEPVVIEPSLCARWGLLERLDRDLGLDWELVVPSDLAGEDGFGVLAPKRGVSLWVVPRKLIDALRRAAAFDRQPGRKTARMLARLPSCAPLRPLLRRVAPPTDRRQRLLL